MSDEREFATEIHEALISDRAIDLALQLWDDLAKATPHDRMGQTIAWLSAIVIRELLVERQREAARTGPWPQEEDGYPGSLLPPKRGTP